MFRRLNDERGWKPWLRKSLLKDPSPSYSGCQKVDRGPRQGPHVFVLFVRILHGDKSEMCTLRDLHDGMKVYQIKVKLELLSGIPTSMMDLHLIKDKSFNDDDVLIQGRNVSFGETIRVNMNSSWNELLQSAWKGSLTDVRRYLTLLETRTQSPIALPNSDIPATREMEREDLLSKALFVVSRRGNEKICKLLLRKGANTTYTTSLGNCSLHTAASAGHLVIIQLLVSHGANVQCRNIHGTSPLEVAVNKGHFDCARWLWLNQWSLAITKDIVAQPKINAFLKPNTSPKPFLTPAYATDARPSSTDFRYSARTHYPISSRQLDRSKRFSNRPHTAYPLSQTLHQDITETHNSLRPNSARVSSVRLHPHSHNEQSNKRGIVSSLQSDKTTQIVNFFTSRRDHQRSIPSKNATFSADISNNEMIATKLEIRSQKEFRKVSKACETRSSTTVTPLRPSSTKVGSGNGRWNDVLRGHDSDDEAETVLGAASYSSVEEDDNFPFQMATTYQSQKTEEPSIVDTLAPPPSPTFPVLKFASIETSFNYESPDIVQDDFKSERVLTIPTSTMNDLDIHSDRSSDDGSKAQQHRVLYVEEEITNTPDSTELADDNYSVKYFHQGDSLPVTEYSSFSDSKQNAVKSESAELEKRQNRNSKSVHFQVEISADINDSIATFNAGSANNCDSRARSSVQILEKPSAEIHQSAASVNTKITPTRKHSVRLEGNSEGHGADMCTKRVQETKRTPSRTILSSESPRNSRRKSHGWSSKGDDHEKGEKNRKAFEIWLAKKRISEARRKEAEKLEKLERKQSHRTSTSMTFDEWLRMKDEEEEISPHEEPKTIHMTKRRENKYQKTFDDWVREKEVEKWNELERRKSVESERKLKEEQESEKRKAEYEQKLEAWKKKKEESKRNELERKKRMDQMAMEYGNLMYEEWMSKPRVKSFDEWKKNKAQESRLNEVSKAQSEMIESQEKELEEIRHQIAKEKFQQWVMKKELGKLKTSEAELEKTRKKRKNRRRLRSLMLNEEGEE